MNYDGLRCPTAITARAREYQERIDFIKSWFKYPDKRFMENIVKQSEKIKDVLGRLAHFKKIDVEQLSDDSIRNLLSLLDQTLEEAELTYETIYNYCPKCGGNIIITTDEVTHYVGQYDDPEPHAFTVWRVAKCEKCGEVFEKEQDRKSVV